MHSVIIDDFRLQTVNRNKNKYYGYFRLFSYFRHSN